MPQKEIVVIEMYAFSRAFLNERTRAAFKLSLAATAIFVFFALIPPPEAGAKAAEECGCNAVLLPDVISHRNDRLLVDDYLSSLTKTDYEKIQETINSGVSLPIEGIPVDFKLSWAKFQERAHEHLEMVNHKTQESVNFAHYEKRLSADAIRAWSACMHDFQTQGTFGLRLEAAQVTPTEVFVQVSWRKFPGGSEKGRIGGIALSQGAVQIGDRIRPGREISHEDLWFVKFTRPVGTPFTLTFDVNGRGDKLIIPGGFPEKPMASRKPEIVIREVYTWNMGGAAHVGASRKDTAVFVAGEIKNFDPKTMDNAELVLRQNGVDFWPRPRHGRNTDAGVDDFVYITDDGMFGDSFLLGTDDHRIDGPRYPLTDSTYPSLDEFSVQLRVGSRVLDTKGLGGHRNDVPSDKVRWLPPRARNTLTFPNG